MSSSSEGSLDDEEFVVEKIVDHRLFHSLVEESLKCKNKFLPGSIRENQKRHPKYAYLVHWEGYDIKDRTWEPEDGLLALEPLARYKRKRDLPPVYETVEHEYKRETFRYLSLANQQVTGHKHLYSRKEIKAIEAERNAKLANQAEKVKQSKERERMVTPEDPEKIMKKKRRDEEEGDNEPGPSERPSESSTVDVSNKTSIFPSFKIPKKNRSEESGTSNPSKEDDENKMFKLKQKIPDRPPGATLKSDIAKRSINQNMNRQPCQPGIQPLASNTPKIQKKVAPTSSDLMTPQAKEATSSVETPIPHVDPCELNLVYASSSTELTTKKQRGISLLPTNLKDYTMPMKPFDKKNSLKKRSSVEIIDFIPATAQNGQKKDGEKKKASAPTVSTPVPAPVEAQTSFDAPVETSAAVPKLIKHKREKEKEREEKTIKNNIKIIKKDIRKIKEEFKRFPVKIPGTRTTRSFHPSLDLLKIRKWKSAEQLNERWGMKAELEMFGKNFEKSYFMPDDKTKKMFIRQYPAEEPPYKPREVSEDQWYSEAEGIFHENWQLVSEILNRKQIGDVNFKRLVENLVKAFSYDDTVLFRDLFTKYFPSGERFDGFKYLTILLITTNCRHRFWKQDISGRTLVEANSSQKWGNVKHHEVLCSEDHRKCTWMEIFMKLLPDHLRFLESSEKQWNGLKDDDGPFRDDIFFHCMKEGAECQKNLFFIYAKPIGIQEDIVGDYSVDAMHLLAVQHGNIQRLGWYMAQGGVDINALATHVPTKTVFRLGEYLQKWKEIYVGDEKHEKYYERLVEFVRFTAEALEKFVECNVDLMINTKMAGRWKTSIDITYPHILRCSPLSNICNGGDNTHQVLSCLFYPQSFGLRDGLPKDGASYDKGLVDKLKSSHRKYQRLVSDKKGRLVLVMFRVNVKFHAKVKKNQPYALPIFELIESDNGLEIEKMTILRQKEGLSGPEADLGMKEIEQLSSPGCHYFGFECEDVEKYLVVPGNAHIEMTGTVKEPMSFVVQVFFFKRKTLVE